MTKTNIFYWNVFLSVTFIAELQKEWSVVPSSRPKTKYILCGWFVLCEVLELNTG